MSLHTFLKVLYALECCVFLYHATGFKLAVLLTSTIEQYCLVLFWVALLCSGVRCFTDWHAWAVICVQLYDVLLCSALNSPALSRRRRAKQRAGNSSPEQP